MMRYFKPLIILIAVLSLFIASEVGAGCAWVLWMRMETGAWYIEDSAESLEDCEKKLSLTFVHYKAENNIIEKFTETHLQIIYKGGNKTVSFTCLPDTVDPRAPKQREPTPLQPPSFYCCPPSPTLNQPPLKSPA